MVGLALLGSPRVILGQGFGDLMVTPTRIVIDGRERTAEVTLLNQGTTTATYRISFKRMRMTEAGKLVDITDSDPQGMYADPFIRYSPRQVVLEPGASQTVRLLVRKPPDLTAGEYRSHLLFRAVPPEDSGADIEAIEGEQDGISIRLIPVFGVSIPVIVRHGELAATAGVSGLSLEPPTRPDAKPVLHLTLERQGGQSIYGDLSVRFKPDRGGEVEVGLVRGIAVYTPNASRSVRLTLNPPEGVALRRGQLRVAYHASGEDRDELLARAEVDVP